jgi:hypothetical protein
MLAQIDVAFAASKRRLMKWSRVGVAWLVDFPSWSDYSRHLNCPLPG